MRRKKSQFASRTATTAHAIPIIALTILITWPVHRAGPTNAAVSLENPSISLDMRVERGKARFRLETHGPQTRYLVVASALARSGGPFPVRLTARPADLLIPPELSNPPLKIARSIPSPPTPVAALITPLPARSRNFSILVREGDPASPSNYQAIRARLKAVGQRVQVYVGEEDENRVSPETLRDLVETFDQRVWPVANRLFGPAHDVDSDGRFTIVMTGLLGHFAAGRKPLDGYVRGADFDTNLSPPLGNGTDLLYLNAALSAGPHLRTILAHEYTHAVVHSRKVLDSPTKNSTQDEEDWLDEALAHLVEDLHGFSRTNLDHRVNAFLATPERYQILVNSYFKNDLLRSHGHRGAAYLFLRWCQNNFGSELLPALVNSPERGVANLESATGVPFENLFQRFSIDLVANAIKYAETTEDPFFQRLPEMRWVEPSGEPECWSALPTTTHFSVVTGGSTGVIEVELLAPEEARLHVSVLPLPEDYPHLEFHHQPGSTKAASRPQLLTHVGGTAVRIESIFLEPIQPRVKDGRHEFTTIHASSSDLIRWFGTDRIMRAGQSVQLDGFPESPKPVPGHRIVVLGTYPGGRRV